MSGSLRYQRLDPCVGCGACDDGQRCEEARGGLRSYSGIRPTSDGFDCALPIAIDSHSCCSYGCYYGFSDNLVAHREGREKGVGQTSLAKVERLFAGEPSKTGDMLHNCIGVPRTSRRHGP